MQPATAIMPILYQLWQNHESLLAWPTYLLVLPLVYRVSGWWSILFMIFPGVYLFSWAGLCIHECWHKYLPNLPNKLLYHVFSWMLLTDPQAYQLVHSAHHAHVNTWDDIEFHPFGNIEHRLTKIVCNILEIFFGMAFLFTAYTMVLPKHPQYKAHYCKYSLYVSACIWAGFLGGLGYASHHLFGVTAPEVVFSYLISLWLGSVVLHHSQLVEHGNLIVAGDWHLRNRLNRNLQDTGLAEKIFLFLTHGDAREHVLHHTLVSVYTRPFPGRVPMPEHSVYITLRDYVKILGDMLVGRESAA